MTPSTPETKEKQMVEPRLPIGIPCMSSWDDSQDKCEKVARARTDCAAEGLNASRFWVPAEIDQGPGTVL